MNDSNDLTPDRLFKVFIDPENAFDDKKQALKCFSELKDKTTFLEPTIKGVKILDEEMKKLQIEYNSLHPKWNYSISPKGE